MMLRASALVRWMCWERSTLFASGIAKALTHVSGVSSADACLVPAQHGKTSVWAGARRLGSLRAIPQRAATAYPAIVRARPCTGQLWETLMFELVGTLTGRGRLFRVIAQCPLAEAAGADLGHGAMPACGPRGPAGTVVCRACKQ